MATLKRRVGYLFPVFMLMSAVLACDIDRSMGTLVPDATPITFSGAVGCNEIWVITLTPNVQYELTIVTTEIIQAQGSHFATVIVRGRDASGNRWIDLGHAETRQDDVLHVEFTAPDSGEVHIIFTAGSRNSFTIQLHEIDG